MYPSYDYLGGGPCCEDGTRVTTTHEVETRHVIRRLTDSMGGLVHAVDDQGAVLHRLLIWPCNLQTHRCITLVSTRVTTSTPPLLSSSSSSAPLPVAAPTTGALYASDSAITHIQASGILWVTPPTAALYACLASTDLLPIMLTPQHPLLRLSTLPCHLTHTPAAALYVALPSITHLVPIPGPQNPLGHASVPRDIDHLIRLTTRIARAVAPQPRS